MHARSNRGRAAASFLALSLSLLSPSARAWGPDGHEIVGAIAFQHLTPQAELQVKQLLSTQQIFDDSIANFADHVRPLRKETAPWHFVDIPISEAKFDPRTAYAGPDCVVTRIDEFRHVLADRTASRDQRVEAIKFLVHLVGDIHQPLHCADNGDRGGNNVVVRWQGSRGRDNLHKVWDSLALRELMGGKSVTDYAAELDAQVDQPTADGWVAVKFVSDWADESHVAARAIYEELKDQIASGQPIALDATYADQHKEVIETQLKRGGIRLATLLNEALDPQVRPLNAPFRNPTHELTAVEGLPRAATAPAPPRRVRPMLMQPADRD